MLEMVEARKHADKGEQRYDLFSGLLDAAQNKLDSEVTLSDEELIGGHSISRQFSILGKWLTHTLRKHVYFPSCWT
jgi:hypothetical protein